MFEKQRRAFFLSQREKSSNDACRPWRSGRQCQTLSLPWCQVRGISFEWFPRPCQTVGPVSGPYPFADFGVAFFEEVGPLQELRRLWFACTVTFDEQTRPGSEPHSLAHDLNPRVPLGLESHFRPGRHEWFYRLAPKIIETIKPYHDDNVGTQSAEDSAAPTFALWPSTLVVLYKHASVTNHTLWCSVLFN